MQCLPRWRNQSRPGRAGGWKVCESSRADGRHCTPSVCGRYDLGMKPSRLRYLLESYWWEAYGCLYAGWTLIVILGAMRSRFQTRAYLAIACVGYLCIVAYHWHRARTDA